MHNSGMDIELPSYSYSKGFYMFQVASPPSLLHDVSVQGESLCNKTHMMGEELVARNGPRVQDIICQ